MGEKSLKLEYMDKSILTKIMKKFNIFSNQYFNIDKNKYKFLDYKKG